MTASHRQPLPLDVFHRMIFHIPATQAGTLATCLRLSKGYCHAVANQLYRNVHIRADTDLLVDTGLKADILDHPGDHGAENYETLVNDKDNVVMASKEVAGYCEGGEPKTLKGRFLGLMRTLDIHPRSRPPAKVRVLVYDDGNESEEDKAPKPAVTRLPSSLTGTKLQLEQVRFRLNTGHHLRPSPFDTPLSEPDLESFQEILLGMIRTRRLVFHGASFSMSGAMMRQILPSFLPQLQEIAVVITSGTVPGPRDPAHNGTGLRPIYNQLLDGHFGVPGIPLSADITFILQTPRESARILVSELLLHEARSSVQYNADPVMAGRYIERMIGELTDEIIEDWSHRRKAKRGKVVLVNFGALDEVETHTSGSTSMEKEDHMKTCLHEAVLRHIPSLIDDISNPVDWKEEIQAIGMQEWWSADRGREQVLDEEIVAGWKEAKVEV